MRLISLRKQAPQPPPIGGGEPEHEPPSVQTVAPSEAAPMELPERPAPSAPPVKPLSFTFIDEAESDVAREMQRTQPSVAAEEVTDSRRSEVSPSEPVMEKSPRLAQTPAKHPILPDRLPLRFSDSEHNMLIREIARETFSALATSRKLGPQDARDRLDAWTQSKNWAGVERDPMTMFAINALTMDWRSELEGICASLIPKGGELLRCDFAAEVKKAAGLRPDVLRILQVSACVPIFTTSDARSLVIGSINPIAAAIVANRIFETLDSPPFVSAMRLTWDAWVHLLEAHGL